MAQNENMFDVILKKLEKIENAQRTEFAQINMKLDSIEKKFGSIPNTYEANENLLGGALRDIELLKKLILNQWA